MNSIAILFNKKNLILFVFTVYTFFWDMFLTLNLKMDIRLIVFLLSSKSSSINGQILRVDGGMET